MFRRAVFVVLAGFAVLNLFGCGGDGDTAQKQPDAQEMARLKIAGQAVDLSTEIEQAKRDLENIRDKQALALGDLQTRLLRLSQNVANLQSSVNALTDQPARDTAPEKTGKRHWLLTILVVAAIVLIFYFLFKRMTREEAEDQDLQDDGFVEENDLGTIRYPGGVKDAGGKPGTKPPRPRGISRGESGTSIS